MGRDIYGQLCSLKWLHSATWPKLPTESASSLNVIDLFCGCGGLSLGVVEAARNNGRSTKIQLAADWAEDALAVYEDNLGNVTKKIVSADLSQVLNGRLGDAATNSEKTLLSDLKKVHFVVAGPPCQGNSDLNNSTRRTDPRNSLYLLPVRMAELVRPEALLIENVPAVIHDRGRVVDRAIAELNRLGYHVHSATLNASEIGLPQTRRRHFLVATKQPGFQINITSKDPNQKPTVREYIADLEHHTNGSIYDSAAEMRSDNKIRADYLIRNKLYDLPDALRPKCHRNGGHSYVSMYGRLRWDQPAQTITSGFGSMGQGRFLHPAQPRTITPHEAARLQGFPDFFKFDRITQRTKLQLVIGNAVPPRISAVIANHLIAGGYI